MVIVSQKKARTWLSATGVRRQGTRRSAGCRTGALRFGWGLGAVAQELRSHKVPAAVFASAERAGAWDAVVRPTYAERATALMQSPENG